MCFNITSHLGLVPVRAYRSTVTAHVLNHEDAHTVAANAAKNIILNLTKTCAKTWDKKKINLKKSLSIIISSPKISIPANWSSTIINTKVQR